MICKKKQTDMGKARRLLASVENTRDPKAGRHMKEVAFLPHGWLPSFVSARVTLQPALKLQGPWWSVTRVINPFDGRLLLSKKYIASLAACWLGSEPGKGRKRRECALSVLLIWNISHSLEFHAMIRKWIHGRVKLKSQSYSNVK